MQTPYKFTVTSGMAGYMPNYQSGPFYASTRRELFDIVRGELEMLSYPENRLASMGLRGLWRFVQAAKSGSSAHTSCDPHNGEQLCLHGLTDAEFDELNEQE